MDQTIVTKNYFTDEGDTLVIGGKLVIEEDAEVVGLDSGSGTAAENQSASTATAATTTWATPSRTRPGARWRA